MEFIGSRYKGSTKNGRMDGEGEYTFPTGTKYVGEMKDWMFHGKGVLFFPNGSKYEATWENGIAKQGSLTFADGLQYQDQNWDYCNAYDRRFYSERYYGFRPQGWSLSICSDSSCFSLSLFSFLTNICMTDGHDWWQRSRW
uniref:MORN repeat-containing protein 5 n=1 Tax=Fundulus heteroclitus TaxID=8078 RepID=A0A3Q2QNR7_FUNHE